MGPDGSLREWLWPGLADNHEHRHASHLYGLWYEPDPDLLADPALRAAAAVIDPAPAGLVGDGRRRDGRRAGQLGLAAAALGLGRRGARDACRALTRYWRPSLVSTHNAGAIFNTDICGGLPALVVAMLVRGGESTVGLLPALPAAVAARSDRAACCCAAASGSTNSSGRRSGSRSPLRRAETDRARTVTVTCGTRPARVRAGPARHQVLVGRPLTFVGLDEKLSRHAGATEE